MAWDDEKRAKAVQLYKQAEPTQETSTQIVSEIAEQLGESPNGVRAILVKQNVYIKKEPAPAAKSAGTTGSKRVSKQDSQNALIAAIQAADKQVDESIISKLTGKAAVYFTSILS